MHQMLAPPSPDCLPAVRRHFRPLRAPLLVAKKFGSEKVDETLSPTGPLNNQCPAATLSDGFYCLALARPELRLWPEHLSEQRECAACGLM